MIDMSSIPDEDRLDLSEATHIDNLMNYFRKVLKTKDLRCVYKGEEEWDWMIGDEIIDDMHHNLAWNANLKDYPDKKVSEFILEFDGIATRARMTDFKDDRINNLEKLETWEIVNV